MILLAYRSASDYAVIPVDREREVGGVEGAIAESGQVALNGVPTRLGHRIP